MDRQSFRDNMKQYKAARELNPLLSYWEWKSIPRPKKYAYGTDEDGILPTPVIDTNPAVQDAIVDVRPQMLSYIANRETLQLLSHLNKETGDVSPFYDASSDTYGTVPLRLVSVAAPMTWDASRKAEGRRGGNYMREAISDYAFPVGSAIMDLATLTMPMGGGSIRLTASALEDGVIRLGSKYKPTRNLALSRALSKELNAATKAYDGTVGSGYFRNANKFYRVSLYPEVANLKELGMNVTTRDLANYPSAVTDWRNSMVNARVRLGNNGYNLIPGGNERISLVKKSGAAHGNKTQAAIGKPWDGTFAKAGDRFTDYMLEGDAPTYINARAGDRSTFALTLSSDLPAGYGIGFDTGTMPMENLRAFRKLPNGRYLDEGVVVPNKRIYTEASTPNPIFDAKYSKFGIESPSEYAGESVVNLLKEKLGPEYDRIFRRTLGIKNPDEMFVNPEYQELSKGLDKYANDFYEKILRQLLLERGILNADRYMYDDLYRIKVTDKDSFEKTINDPRVLGVHYGGSGHNYLKYDEAYKRRFKDYLNGMAVHEKASHGTDDYIPETIQRKYQNFLDFLEDANFDLREPVNADGADEWYELRATLNQVKDDISEMYPQYIRDGKYYLKDALKEVPDDILLNVLEETNGYASDYYSPIINSPVFDNKKMAIKLLRDLLTYPSVAGAVYTLDKNSNATEKKSKGGIIKYGDGTDGVQQPLQYLPYNSTSEMPVYAYDPNTLKFLQGYNASAGFMSGTDPIAADYVSSVALTPILNKFIKGLKVLKKGAVKALTGTADDVENALILDKNGNVVIPKNPYSSPTLKLPIATDLFSDEAYDFFQNDVLKRSTLNEALQAEYLNNRNNFLYDLYPEDGIAEGVSGSYSRITDNAKIAEHPNKNRFNNTISHEFRHRFEDTEWTSDKYENLLNRAYTTKNRAHAKLVEKQATNTEMRNRLYLEYQRKYGKTPTVKEMNKLIDSLPELTIDRLLLEQNAYSQSYFNWIASMVETKGAKGAAYKKAKYAYIKRALKRVPMVAGGAAIARDNKTKSN